MTSLHVPDHADRLDPRAPRRPDLHVLPTPPPPPAASDTAGYESMSIPQLCRVILDADDRHRWRDRG